MGAANVQDIGHQRVFARIGRGPEDAREEVAYRLGSQLFGVPILLVERERGIQKGHLGQEIPSGLGAASPGNDARGYLKERFESRKPGAQILDVRRGFRKEEEEKGEPTPHTIPRGGEMGGQHPSREGGMIHEA
jgi:hypothetical protein